MRLSVPFLARKTELGNTGTYPRGCDQAGAELGLDDWKEGPLQCEQEGGRGRDIQGLHHWKEGPLQCEQEGGRGRDILTSSFLSKKRRAWLLCICSSKGPTGLLDHR